MLSGLLQPHTMCSSSIFHLFSTYVLSLLCTSFGLPLRNKTGNSVTSPVSSYDVISLYGEQYARTEEELDYFFKRQQRLNRSGIDIDVSTITLSLFPPFTKIVVCSLIRLFTFKLVANIDINITNNMYPYQTAPPFRSSLIRVHSVCVHGKASTCI